MFIDYKLFNNLTIFVESILGAFVENSVRTSFTLHSTLVGQLSALDCND